ncbi:MAG: hypothetical protein ACRDLV_09780 [Solirubrobacteraceae bacterium]
MPTPAAPAPAAAAAPAARPFLQGSWDYSEPMFSDTGTPGANAQNFSHPITPGGYLRGVTLSVSSAGGVIGAGVLGADAPWSVLQRVELESIDGTSLRYPLGGYATYLVQKYTRPWDRDPAQDPAFSNTINPAFRLKVFVESRATIGVVPNTDARAQYRIKYALAPLSDWCPTAPTTAPNVTIETYVETYAQPPAADLNGVPFVAQPPGLAFQRFVSHSTPVTAGGDFKIKAERVGNMIRTLLLVFRDNSGSQGGAGTRVDLTGDPIRWTLDNTTLLVENRDRRDLVNDEKFGAGAQALDHRPTGVYVYTRSHHPGEVQGESWLETTEASLLQWEVNGAPAGGACEIITEDLVPTVDAAHIPAWMIGL